MNSAAATAHKLFDSTTGICLAGAVSNVPFFMGMDLAARLAIDAITLGLLIWKIRAICRGRKSNGGDEA